MADDITYENIDRPYDSFLQRTELTASENSNTDLTNGVTDTSVSSSTTTPSSTTASTNGNTETQPVKSSGSMDNLWITNYLRSDNWKPKSVGFFIDGQSGKAEFTDVYVSGEIQALTGLIGGFTIGATDLTASAGGNTTIFSSGVIAFAAGPTGTPTVTITQAGILNATGANISGTLTATTGVIGGWTINTTNLSATGIVLDSLNERIQVGSSAPILIDGINKRIQSDNYVSGAFGSGFHLDSNLLEVGNIACRGMFRTATFTKDVVNVIAGSFVVAPNGDTLDADMTSADNSTLTTKGTVTLLVNDILRMKESDGSSVDDEWLIVTNTSSAPTYTVLRDRAGNYSSNAKPAWKKGAAVVDYGQSGAGGVYMTASDVNAPYLSVFDHTGSPWSSINTRLRLGNLNGYLGYATDVYGIAIGDSTNNLKYDPSNGLRIAGNITLGSTNSIKGGQTAYNTGQGFWMGYDSGKYKMSLGNPSGDYMYWDGSHLILNGTITFTGGSLPWSLITNDGHKPADDATVGATWGVNLGGIPTTLTTPSGAGLYLSATNLGFFNGSAWKTYMDASGNFFLGGTGGALQWDATNNILNISGNVSASTIDIGGNDATSFHVDINGNMWAGAATYNQSTNPFSVSNAGALTATSGTFKSATIDAASTIDGLSAATLADAIDSSGHFADNAISTATSTILGSFTFGASGALQIGTYVNGVSGDLKISPTGILARDSTGATTFSINGTTGVAVVSGLVVGTNVGLGTAQTASQVTTIIGNTVTTGYVNALGITAGSVSANNITAGTITGSTLQTAASGQRIVIASSPSNLINFYNSSTLYGSLEVTTSGSEGVINLAAVDGGGLFINTGVGASGYSSVEISAQGGSFASSGNASNGFATMSATGNAGTSTIEASASGYTTDITVTANTIHFVGTVTINGSAIGGMVYPGAGIAISTGSGWTTSTPNYSSYWTTAYNWGNHATAGYATTTYVGTYYPLKGSSGTTTLNVRRVTTGGVDSGWYALTLVDGVLTNAVVH